MLLHIFSTQYYDIWEIMVTFVYRKKCIFEIGVLAMLNMLVFSTRLQAQSSSHFNTIGGNKTIEIRRISTPDSLAYDDDDEYSDEGQIADVSADSLTSKMPMVALPLKSLKVNSPFGMRRDPLNRKKVRMHNGIDLSARYEAVYSMLPGKVVASGYSTNGGYYVTVSHDACVCSYLHLSKIKVKRGQYVAAGQVIAISGNSGKRTTGAHLHLACRMGDAKGKFFDPMVILNFVMQQMLSTSRL